MDRPTNHDIRVMLAAIRVDEVLGLREIAHQAGLRRLVKAADDEIRRRSNPDVEGRLRPYRATLHRIV